MQKYVVKPSRCHAKSCCFKVKNTMHDFCLINSKTLKKFKVEDKKDA